MNKFCLITVGFLVAISIAIMTDFNAVSGDTFSTGASTNTVPGTLTISGINLTPVLAIGTNDTSHQTAVLVQRTIAQATNGAHAFEDFTTLSANGPYATFDARAQVSNTIDHVNGFQFRPQLHAGSFVTNMIGVEVEPTIDSGGTNLTMKGIYIEDSTGSGSLGNQYGLYIDTLAKGSNNFSIVTGTSPSQFSGNVGVGKAPTANPLDVSGTINSDSVTTPRIITPLLEFTKDYEHAINLYYDGGYKFRDTGYGFLFNLNSGSYYWRLAGSGSAGAAATLSAKMVLDTSGNLGIGAFPPTANLDVVGTIKASSTVTASGYTIAGVAGFTGFTTNGLSGFVTNKLYWSGGIVTNVTTISF